MVTSGVIRRNAKVRLIRDGAVNPDITVDITYIEEEQVIAPAVPGQAVGVVDPAAPGGEVETWPAGVGGHAGATQPARRRPLRALR